MKQTEFNKTIEEALNKVLSLLVLKNAEYANTTDVFHNFRNAVGLSFYTKKESVAWEFNVKHLQSIKDIIDYIEKNNSVNVNKEKLDEKIIDAINYLLIIRAMVIERIDND